VTLRLEADGWAAELRPEIGGCLASLTLNGLEVLRTMPEGSREPLESACFPLVPYCNRIRDARFTWQAREVRLPANFAPEPHNLHGIGWQQPWDVTRNGGFKCSLAHSYDGNGGWPWAYDAEQRVRLGPQGCAITLDLTNRADTPMPCGLGLHPYLRRRPETRVAFTASAMLEVDAGLIPNGATTSAGKWSSGQALPDHTIDHCLVEWDGVARASDDLGSVTVRARGGRFLHLYAPADGSALCLEPVSHQPDALNSAPEQMIVLPPDCTASLTMWISAD
jgi:aldose 1-epimerase